jgi:hypothetical protein
VKPQHTQRKLAASLSADMLGSRRLTGYVGEVALPM